MPGWLVKSLIYDWAIYTQDFHVYIFTDKIFLIQWEGKTLYGFISMCGSKTCLIWCMALIAAGHLEKCMKSLFLKPKPKRQKPLLFAGKNITRILFTVLGADATLLLAGPLIQKRFNFIHDLVTVGLAGDVQVHVSIADMTVSHASNDIRSQASLHNFDTVLTKKCNWFACQHSKKYYILCYTRASFMTWGQK